MKDTFKNRIKLHLSYWASHTSFHGIQKISNTSNMLLVVFWLGIFCGLFCYGIYMLICNMDIYFSHKVETSMKYNQKNEIIFPTVTVCNLNMFNTGSERFLIKNQLELWMNRSDDSRNKNYGDLRNYYQIAEDFYKTLPYLKQSNLTNKEVVGLSFSLEEMLLSCRFNKGPCNVNDFTGYWNYHYGMCYKFNADGRKMIKNHGSKYGLQLEFYVGKIDRLSLTKTSGMKIFVHDSKIIPDFSQDGTLVPTGAETNILIEQTNFNRKSQPFSNCIRNVTVDSELSTANAKRSFRCYTIYNQKYCFLSCLNDYVYAHCKCNIPEFRMFYSGQFNYSYKGIQCVQEKSHEFYQNTTRTQMCIKNCPIECNSVKYTLSVSQAAYPSDYYARFMQVYLNQTNATSMDFTDMTKTNLAINLFFQDIAFRSMDEYPAKEWPQLLADAGGILSICIGASLLSLAEILDLILGFILILFGPPVKNEQLVAKDDKESYVNEENLIAKLKEYEKGALRQEIRIDRLEFNLGQLMMVKKRARSASVSPRSVQDKNTF